MNNSLITFLGFLGFLGLSTIFGGKMIQRTKKIIKSIKRKVLLVEKFLWGTVKLISFLIWFPIKFSIFIVFMIPGVFYGMINDLDGRNMITNVVNPLWIWDHYAWKFIKSFYDFSEPPEPEVINGVYKE